MSNNINNQYYSKFCDAPCDYEKYTLAFHLELDHMRKLQQLMNSKNEGNTYSKLFPSYYALHRGTDGKPYLDMEEICGETLEDYLCRQPHYIGPRSLLTSRQILHIYEQIYLAVDWLYQGNIIQLDLSPQNIMINKQFDIRLVDFTDCYYTDLSPSDNIKKGCKMIDYRINSNAPFSQQVRDSYALLFSRLFFCGEKHYNEHFSAISYNEKSRQNRYFFEKEYPQILNCLFYPDTSSNTACKESASYPLSDWNIWYWQLHDLLIAKMY